mmetsp:Transcript_177608/g.569580  ORF Transcript_177608/g.569580 Transcript_177608/m.569580 type:complete len:214 (-) Transcript_177608:22-663(-)
MAQGVPWVYLPLGLDFALHLGDTLLPNDEHFAAAFACDRRLPRCPNCRQSRLGCPRAAERQRLGLEEERRFGVEARRFQGRSVGGQVQHRASFGSARRRIGFAAHLRGWCCDVARGCAAPLARLRAAPPPAGIRAPIGGSIRAEAGCGAPQIFGAEGSRQVVVPRLAIQAMLGITRGIGGQGPSSVQTACIKSTYFIPFSIHATLCLDMSSAK